MIKPENNKEAVPLKKVISGLLAVLLAVLLTGCQLTILPPGQQPDNTSSTTAVTAENTTTTSGVSQPTAAGATTTAAGTTTSTTVTFPVTLPSDVEIVTTTAGQTTTTTAAPRPTVPTTTKPPVGVSTTSTTSPATTTTVVGQTHTPLAYSEYYQYATMTERERTVYDRLRLATQTLQTNVGVSDIGLTETEMKSIFSRFMADNPQYFWLAPNYAYSLGGSGIYSYILMYSDGTKTDEVSAVKANRDTIQQQREAFDAKIREIVSTIPANASEPQKEKMIHDYLVESLCYDHSAAANPYYANNTLKSAFCAYGALIDKSAVCEGYTEAFQALCYAVGVNANRVEGIGHAWNVVRLDGEWYELDVTWDDPVYPDGRDTGMVWYTYYNLTTAEMKQSHPYDPDTLIKSPVCTATKYAHQH